MICVWYLIWFIYIYEYIIYIWSAAARSRIPPKLILLQAAYDGSIARTKGVIWPHSMTPLWKSPRRMMSGLSRSWAGLDEALTCRFLSSYVARRCLHKASLASREERPCRFVRIDDPVLPGLVQGLILDSRTSAIVKSISYVIDGWPHGPDVGMCDGRLTVSTYPVLHVTPSFMHLKSVFAKDVLRSMWLCCWLVGGVLTRVRR